MKPIVPLLFFLICNHAAYSQRVAELSDESVEVVTVELSDEEMAVELPDEEDYAAYFLPVRTGNGNYLPMGQLARNLIGMRFRPRGYDYRYQRYEVNGTELSDPTDGFPYWNIIAAINLMPRSQNDLSGLSIGDYALGGLGGVSAVSTTDRFISSGERLSYATTNRTYRHRATASLRETFGKGLGISGGISARGGKDGYVAGVFSQRLDVSGMLFRRWQNHTVSLLAAATDSDQGVRSAATQEAYDLARTPYYNPNWGYQNEAVRNSKVRRYRNYFSALAWNGSWGNGWSGQAALSFFGGQNAYTSLAWYDAPTPYPDYYRYMPDNFYSSPETASDLRQAWFEENPEVTQIDWAKLYEVNLYNFDDNGIARSHYILRDWVTDKQNLQAHAAFRYQPDRKFALQGGFRLRADRSDQYSRLSDLLGGSYWTDIDQYLLDDEQYGAMYQNDIRNPDRPVFAGQRFGYDYRMRSQNLRAWGAARYNSAEWEVFGGIEVGLTEIQREGRYEKEMFPDSLSYGPSVAVRIPEYRLKAGAFYRFSLRQRLGVQALVGAQAPLVDNLFLAPNYRNETIGAWNPVQTTSVELLYQWNSPVFTLDVTTYATSFRDDSQVNNFYDDVTGQYLNFVMTDIAKFHGGVEIGAQWNISARFSLLAALSENVYRYANDPSVALYCDSDGKLIVSDEPAFLKGLHLSGTPQGAAMLLLSYRSRSGWRLEGSAKRTARNYVTLNPARRMSRALSRAASNEVWQEMMAQERLDDAFLLGLSVSKTFYLPGGDRIALWINLDNLTDDRSVRYSGYEQWRLSARSSYGERTLSSFPSKYYYAYGANFYAMITYSF
ncbi:MAG: hypothetical protein LBM20_06360 [Rikenellaceae bacterium]|jgi:hypothetical protein|nr:hypothetical protein [Rikenellaceae bacterium]